MRKHYCKLKHSAEQQWLQFYCTNKNVWTRDKAVNKNFHEHEFMAEVRPSTFGTMERPLLGQHFNELIKYIRPMHVTKYTYTVLTRKIVCNSSECKS